MCQEIRLMRRSAECGSGSILGFGLIFLVLGIMTLSLGLTTQSLAIARLQAQTDNAALAAEDVLRGLSVGFPCETAEEIVQGFGGTLEECHKVNLDIYISVRSQVMGIVQRVHARAKPS
jgi:secretion/DNA translocation related TadE-like protein